ncbi:MAG: NUDIX domain-containing protein [Chitinophagaceae bacterium]
MRKNRIKILFKDKRIFLQEKNIPATNTTPSYIIHNLTPQKIELLIDILLISDLKQVLIIGDIDTSMQILKQTMSLVQAGGGLVINPQHEMLFIYRKGKWDLPKGKIEKQEDIEQCAIREVQEETNLKNIHIVKHLSNSYHIYFEEIFILKETFWYLMTSEKESVKPQYEEGITKVLWVDTNKIKYQLNNTYENIKDLVNMCLYNK